MDMSARTRYNTRMVTSAVNPSLPTWARLPINRCSLPAVLLGSLSYQRHPVPLALDGVLELYRCLFTRLDALEDVSERAGMFERHMRAEFSMENPEAAGFRAGQPAARAKAHYLRMVRGWSFDSDGREGAVLKGWVESRFGLLPRFHGAPIRDFSGEAYRAYLEQRATGLYGTNGLEAQFDLLYTFCQYELGRRRLGETHVRLYRGVNRLMEHEALGEFNGRRGTVLLNSLVSFTASRERADEFGDAVLSARVPLAKVFFFHDLLPGLLRGEDEYAVIGGVYEVERIA